MDQTDPQKRLDKEIHDRDCLTCASRPRFIISVLDPRKGRTIRVFECQCGEAVWDD